MTEFRTMDEAETAEKTKEAAEVSNVLLQVVVETASEPIVGISALARALLMAIVENTKSYESAIVVKDGAMETINASLKPMWDAFIAQGGRTTGTQNDDDDGRTVDGPLTKM